MKKLTKRVDITAYMWFTLNMMKQGKLNELAESIRGKE